MILHKFFTLTIVLYFTYLLYIFLTDSCDEDSLDDNFFLNSAKYFGNKCSDEVQQKKR